MTLRFAASRLWLFAWFAVWLVVSHRMKPSSATASGFGFLFGGAGVLAGLYLFFHGFELLRRKRWIEDTPVTRISSAPLGKVKVFGTANGPYTLLSPLSGQDCLFYRATAQNGRGEDDEGAAARAVESCHTPIFVEDESGSLPLDPRGAHFEFPNQYEEVIDGVSMSEGTRRFLRRHALSVEAATTVNEFVIKPGDPILVLACLEEPPGLASAATTCRETSCLSPEAADLQRREQMEAMGIPHPEPVAPARGPAGRFDMHPRAVLQLGADREPFILSHETPQRLIGRLAQRSFLDIWGGAALAILSASLVIRWAGL